MAQGGPDAGFGCRLSSARRGGGGRRGRGGGPRPVPSYKYHCSGESVESFAPQTSIPLFWRCRDFLSGVLHLPQAPGGEGCGLEPRGGLPTSPSPMWPGPSGSEYPRRSPSGCFDPSGRERVAESSQGLPPPGRLRSWAVEGVTGLEGPGSGKPYYNLALT